MNPAKIRLSPAELELVADAGLILTKNAILKKVQGLLESLLPILQELIAVHAAKLPEKVSGSSPKISKGENYKGLPYYVLDYPRVFEHEKFPDRQTGIFAVRTIFWWGNFFSVTIHLSGIYKVAAASKLIAAYSMLKEKKYYCTINDDPWEHHFETDNYKPVQDMSVSEFQQWVREKSFIKLANKVPLQNWDNAREILAGYFKDLIEMMADQPPNR